MYFVQFHSDVSTSPCTFNTPKLFSHGSAAGEGKLSCAHFKVCVCMCTSRDLRQIGDYYAIYKGDFEIGRKAPF